MMCNQGTGFFYIFAATMRKLFKQIHKWLAIPAGLIITITCLTGAILVFQDEILELAYPSRYFVKEVKSEPLPLEKLIPIVNENLHKNTVANVKISSDPERAYVMQLTEGFRVNAFVNQYTGEITGIQKANESFFFKVMQIHRWLMDGSRSVGKYAVGIATLLLVFILISGITLLFLRDKKKLKKYFTIKRKNGTKRFLSDLHRVLGTYCSVIILICALTGLMWSFEWYRNGIFKILGADTTRENEGRGHGNRGDKKEKEQLNIVYWQQVVDELKAKNANFDYIRIADKNAAVHSQNAPTSRATDDYIFESNTGNIIKTTLYKDQAKISKIWEWIYALHVGNYWGLFSKIITFIAALTGASLPLTGYYIFFQKKRKSRKN